MKIVHAADLHIDSPLRGLSRYPNAPVDVIRNATRRAFENLIDLCLQERVALLLLAGDVFDGNWRDYSTGMFFAAQLARLRQGGVRVVTVRGNHDAKSQITRELRLPENVTELSTRKPETKVFEDLGIAVHGQGFAAREVPEDLVVRYPRVSSTSGSCTRRSTGGPATTRTRRPRCRCCATAATTTGRSATCTRARCCARRRTWSSRATSRRATCARPAPREPPC